MSQVGQATSGTKGITLIALVITIIILVILAGITIASLTGDGIFKKAIEGKQKDKEAREQEENLFADFEFKINEVNGELWKNLLQASGIDSSKYSNIEEALNDTEVLTSIKNSPKALKMLSKNNELFKIAYNKDDTIDDEVIKVGIVPVMSSNTMPPYTLSANNIYQTYGPWKAFDKSIVFGSCFHTNPGKPVLLTIDLSEQTQVTSFSLTTPEIITSMPKDFTFEGSNNGTDWNIIKRYTDITDYTAFNTKLFVLDKSEKYRYYRLNISEDNGFNHIAITEIQLYN